MHAQYMWRMFTFAIGLLLILALAHTASAVFATGGDLTETNGYRIHTFTSNGTFAVTGGGAVDVLVVAGGGGGGNSLGGGGGAGGLIYTNSYAVTTGSITVTVGAGGAGGLAQASSGGSNGTNSTFGALTAYGGGGGAGWNTIAPKNGGSGGGAYAGDTGALGTNGQGNAGGNGGTASGNYPCGGGGAAGSVGSNGVSTTTSGDGGIGLEYSQFAGVGGSPAGWFAGGGGGGIYLSGTSGTGGAGGGGDGGVAGGNNPGSPGQANTGGGGGAGAYQTAYSAGGDGGSGIVIVRYENERPRIANLAATNATSTSAYLNGDLISTGQAPVDAVSVYWGATDGGEVPGNWANQEIFSPTPQVEGPLTTNVTGLSSNTTYYYRFYATNSYGENWASPSTNFKTRGVPAVDNDGGASFVGKSVATLNGNLTDGGAADVYVYWGATDGGTTNSNWANTNYLGELSEGSFSTNLSSLNPETTYYYRCYATNDYGAAWADSTTNFTTTLYNTYYVTTSGDDTADGLSWATAFLTISNGVANAINGESVLVASGTYPLSAEVVITNGITLQGFYGRSNTVVRRSEAANYRLFTVSNANAVLEGLELRNGAPISPAYGGAVYMTAGTIRDCNLVSNNVAVVGGAGGAVYMTGGTVRDCDVTYNNGWDGGGAGLYLNGSCLVSNCFIAWNSGAYYGGGIGMWTASAGAIVTHCVISSNTNTSYLGAGGIYMYAGTVQNCLIAGNRQTMADNRAVPGVLQYGGTLLNCTIAGNQGMLGNGLGGGVRWVGGSITNTIIYGNTLGGEADNLYASALTTIGYSCAPELTNGVNGNITADPEFIDIAGGNYRLLLGSPAIDSGTNMPDLTIDLDRAVRPQDGDGTGGPQWDMGAYEGEASTSGVLRCSFQGSPLIGMEPLTVVFQASVAGTNTSGMVYRWDVNGDGTNDQTQSGPGLTNIYAPGIYNVALTVSNAAGTAQRLKSAYVTAQAPALFVATGGAHTSPFTNWAMAATNLTDALPLAGEGTTITVTNGVYDCIGGTLAYATVLQSVNGSAATTLRNPPSSTNRLLDITHAQAVVTGFTLVGGAPGVANGGAVNMTAGTIRDCNLVSNSVTGAGGGGAVYMTGGAVRDCDVTYNNGPNGGGGLYLNGSGLVSNCFIAWNQGGEGGGGIGMWTASAGAVVTHCVINNNTNSSWNSAGGIYMYAGTVRNCLIAGNRQTFGDNRGTGGVRMGGGTLLNCTIAGNQGVSANRGGGVGWGGGAITNTIIYGNTLGGTNNNFDNIPGSAPPVGYSCAPELTNGVGNITSDPQFVYPATNNYRLFGSSPARNAGTNQAWMIPPSGIDLDGAGRIRYGTVDMGAYEYQPPPGTVFTIH